MHKLINFIQEVQTELQSVTWPTRKQATKMTLIVITASILVGLLIAALDYLFTTLLSHLLV